MPTETGRWWTEVPKGYW